MGYDLNLVFAAVLWGVVLPMSLGGLIALARGGTDQEE